MSEGNLARLVLRHAEERPDHPALVVPRRWSSQEVLDEQSVTFGELAARIGNLRRELGGAGLREGDRVILMFPVSVELYALALALLAEGMVVVLIDAGMGPRRVVQAIADARARAIVSVHALLKHRYLVPALWRLKKFCVDENGLFLRRLPGLQDQPPPIDHAAAPVPRGPDDPGLITFTGGSTGRCKGSDRTHALLEAQHRALAAEFPSRPDDLDMPCFPVVVLHDLCSGVTAFLPPVDLRAPASVDAALVLGEIRRRGVTTLSGAPAYMERLVQEAEVRNLVLPLRHVIVGGAPVERDLCRRIRRRFPDAVAQVVYGSTEAEPIAHADMAEVEAADGPGYLVGRTAAAAEVELVRLPDGADLATDGIAPFRVAAGEVGEVLVRGEHVNRRYVDNPQATREAKLRDPDGSIWHRTGDLARRDSDSRLWLVGRLKDAVTRNGRAHHELEVESLLNRLPGVVRSALVAHEDQPEGEVALVLESSAERSAALSAVGACLEELGLPGTPVRVLPNLPVDYRHQSKIDRPALRELLQTR